MVLAAARKRMKTGRSQNHAVIGNGEISKESSINISSSTVSISDNFKRWAVEEAARSKFDGPFRENPNLLAAKFAIWMISIRILFPSEVSSFSLARL